MVALHARMPRPLQQTRMVQEQLGFALGRLKRYDEAANVLREVIEKQGPSSETNGLLGRVHKDRWKEARLAGDRLGARGHLRNAIEAYVAGFEADWRDTYPGINAVSLMEMLEKPDPRQSELLPVVRYSALQRVRSSGDYWDHATLMERQHWRARKTRRSTARARPAPARPNLGSLRRLWAISRRSARRASAAARMSDG